MDNPVEMLRTTLGQLYKDFIDTLRYPQMLSRNPLVLLTFSTAYSNYLYSFKTVYTRFYGVFHLSTPLVINV